MTDKPTEIPAKKQKGLISEGDISTLLQRYNATAVLALLQEVAQSPEVKIDWEALVKKTSTGISNAREYQMLWRHLAYCHPMLDKLDNGAQPLDDDSDLEYEVEAFPGVTNEASTEAASCVKRWATIRKRKGNLNKGVNSNGSQLSEAMKAARHALDIPENMKLMVAANNSAGTALNSLSYKSGLATTIAEASPASGSSTRAQGQSQQGAVPVKSSSGGATAFAAKSHVTTKLTSPKSNHGSDSVRATVVAVGAHIASSSDVDSLMKAAKAKNAVHIMPTSGSNVHYMSASLAAPVSTYPAALTSASRPAPAKGAPLAAAATSTSMPSEQINPATSSMTSKLQTESQTVEESKVCGASNPTEGEVLDDGLHHSGDEPSKEIQEMKPDLPSSKAELRSLVAQRENPNRSSDTEMAECRQEEVNFNRHEESPNTIVDDVKASPVKGDNQSPTEEK